jgi:diguanylate cyclase (GGDEF)-like protein
MAHHDALTSLPNRVLLRLRMEETIAGMHRGPGFAVLCIDLDNFKWVNDTLGHSLGDVLLQSVAARLRPSFASRTSLPGSAATSSPFSRPAWKSPSR